MEGQEHSLGCNPVGRVVGPVVAGRILVAIVVAVDEAGRVAGYVIAGRDALVGASWWVIGLLRASIRWGNTRIRELGLVGRIVARRTEDGFGWGWRRRLWKVLVGGRRLIGGGGSRDRRVVGKGG